jgi:glycosyltransferase involved in cell wall biosynthesis
VRVLYVARSHGVHDERFVAAWRAAGHEVRSIARDGRAPGQDGAPVDLGAELDRVLPRFAPDVVQAGPVTDVVPEVAAHWQGPLVATSWGFDLMADVQHDPTLRSAASSALQRADVTLVDNDAVADVARSMGIDDQAIVQFPWGIDRSFYTPGRGVLREELHWRDFHVVLSSRRHEPLYQVDVVVRAFVAAAVRAPGLRLLLAGSGSVTPELMRIVGDAGVEHRVHLAGELEAEALRDAYRSADLYVSASRTDGSSVSLLEAMACGTAVCVSEIPGNKQWVTSDTGRTFPVGDVAALTAELLELGESDPAVLAQRTARVDAASDLVSRYADWSVNQRRLVAAGERALWRRASAS